MSEASAPSATRSGTDLRTRRLRRTTQLVLGVAGVPSAALLTLGVIVMATGYGARDVVFGILIIGMAATVATGVVVTSILLAREAELARLQSEFLSRVSHDLRTPLTSIRMFVETLQLGRAHDPNTTRECLDSLATETDRLLAMVDRLLDWAKIESARRVYHPRRANVALIVDRALESLEALRLQREATITRVVPAQLPDVEVDSQAMTDALVNLLQNAWHYTPDEAKKIGIEVRVDGDEVLIAVSDNGPGVAPSERNKIFERFYRGTAAKTRLAAGTGLGLAMVRAVVRAHHGEVRVGANPGGGSVFTIALPIAETPR